MFDRLPDSDINERLQDARQASRRGDWATAMDRSHDVLALHPDNEEATDLAALAERQVYAAMHELAERLSPRLVLFPDHSADEDAPNPLKQLMTKARSLVSTTRADDVTAARRSDYHPRDIRLVLQGAGIRTYLGGPKVLPILAGLSPRVFLIGFAIASTLGAWLAASFESLFGVPEGDISWPQLANDLWWSIVVSAIAVASGFLLLGTLHALDRLPRWWWLVHAATCVLTLWRLLEVGGEWLIAPNLFALFTLLAVPLAYVFTGIPRAKSVLRALDKPGARATRAEQNLVYFHAGAPGDTKAHRRAYVDLRDELSKKHREYGDLVAYANVSRGMFEYEDAVAVQYWLAYYYNDWENRHEMDWEQVTVYAYLPRAGTYLESLAAVRPVACAFSSHYAGHLARWRESEEMIVRDGHPVVYVAFGSHANYPKPGRYNATTQFAGLRFGGREASLLKKPQFGYVDETPAADAERRSVRVVTIPPARASGTAEEWWTHWCETIGDECTHESDDGKNYDKSTRMCEKDFRWLNLAGAWGHPGTLLGGDAAPTSPPKHRSWKPFDWLTECEPVDKGRGSRIVLDEIERLRDA